MSRKWIIPLFVLTVTVVPVTVAALVKWGEGKYGALPVLGPADGQSFNFQFRGQGGMSFSSGDWKGKVVVAHCFFSHCPVVCPRMIEQLRKIHSMTGVIISSFSVDPERDSVQRLQDYDQQLKLGPDWFLVTGNKKEMYRFLRKQLQLVATDGDGGPLDFIHSENLALIDQQGRIRGYYRGTDPDETDRLQQDIKKLTRQ